MVYMFIACITMVEGSDVMIGFLICHSSGKDSRNGVVPVTYLTESEPQTLNALLCG